MQALSSKYSTHLATWVKPYPHGLGEGWETMQEGAHHLAWCLHTRTHKGGIELRACNSQPSEPFIYWGLKSYRSTFNDISLCKKKKALTLKKAQKALQPIKKKWATEKKPTKKHYAAFKSIHYDPWAWRKEQTKTTKETPTHNPLQDNARLLEKPILTLVNQYTQIHVDSWKFYNWREFFGVHVLISNNGSEFEIMLMQKVNDYNENSQKWKLL